MSWLREPDAEPIPGYRLIEPLGAGGFGEVWKCIAPGGLLKAIKFVYGNLNSEDVDAVRAEQEKRALKRVLDIRHPFVLSNERIEGMDGSPDGELMIVMELADKSLYDRFVECQAADLPGIPRAELLRYLSDAADGLDFMIEKHNLQHLDVKPRNLFLMSDRVKVADFGLVKSLERSSSSGVMGGVTPIYAAPETFKGRISKHSDQYSLAIVYVELLTGKRPFQGKNIRQIALQHLTDPPDLSMLAEVDRPVVGRALSKKPDDRFPSCMAFISALRPPYQSQGSMPVIDLGDAADYGALPVPAELPLTGEMNGDGPAPTPAEDEGPPTALLDRDARPDISLATRPAERRQRVAPPRTAAGILRPTLVIGVGAFGRHALLGLRSRLLDRFGDIEQLPSFRFLYLDSDPDAVRKATAGTSEVALTSAEVFPLPLQPVAKYRQRVLEHLGEWLPREKLYNIPRSLQAGPHRALGRLAFCDNFLRLQARLRRELTGATQTESLLATAENSGLPAADNCPRIYVLASATEGVSGLLTDLGYAIRRQLDLLDFPHAPTVGVIYCGAPFDPATPAIEQANLYATLTELNHFHDDGVPFQARYDPNGPLFADHGPAFGCVYLTLRRDRTPDALRECVARVATYLTHDLATPLGADLDRRREAEPAAHAVPFRAFGTATVWYPRGLLLHVAARMACARMLGHWRAPDPPTAPAEAEVVATAATAAAGLSPEALLADLDRAASIPGEGTPAEAVERLLASLEVQAASTSDAGHWSAQALERVKEWAGSGSVHDADSPWQKSRFFRPLQLAAKQLAGTCADRMTEDVLSILKHSGHRLANGEAAIRKLIDFCDQGIAVWAQQADQHFETLRPVRDALPTSQGHCCGGGFNLFGGGAQRALRTFLGQLGQFARLRIAQDRLECGLFFFRSLRGELDDRLRDLGFSRQRLKALEQVLIAPVGDWHDQSGGDKGTAGDGLGLCDPFWEAVQRTGSVEIILPFGIPDLEETATQFVVSLQPDHIRQLDEELQERVLGPLGNLMSACTGNTNLLRHLGRPLIEQTATFLSALLPISDVAQVEFSAAESKGIDLGARFRRVFDQAAPESGPMDEARSAAFLLVPDSDAGRTLAITAQRAVPSLQLVFTPSPAEMTVCREGDNLSLSELEEILTHARRAYQEMAPQPPTSPHARFDVAEWLPLEP